MKRSILRVCLLLLLPAVSACGGGGGGGGAAPAAAPAATGDIPPYIYEPPEANQDGWEVASLEDQQMDTDRIERMVNGMLQGDIEGIDGIAIARRGQLLLVERFARTLDEFDGWIGNRDPERHVLHSSSKSFTSAMVGIAIDQGYIGGVETPYYQFFDYDEYDNYDGRKDNMTLEDVLTMRLGLEWDEWSAPYGDRDNDLTQLTSNNTDWTKALLDLPMAGQPGTVYAYNTAATTSMCDAVARVTGMPAEDFAEAYLFEPLLIEEAEWDLTPTFHPVGGSGLFLTPRSMAKFGQLYLDDGRWLGQQIISEAWVARSLEPIVSLGGEFTTGYGYQWWLGDFREGARAYPFFSTRGYGGQFIVVIEELDLVIAFVAQNYTNGLANLPLHLVEDEIIPSVLDR